MDEPQPTFKVVDRRPFNPDGTPREVPPEDKPEASESSAPPEVQSVSEAPSATASVAPTSARQPEEPPTTATDSSRSRGPAPRENSHAGIDPLDDPASFLSLIMSLASNAAASLGMMPHPVTGESGVDLNTAKHWIDVLGMLEQKTQGNLSPQEAQVMEGLLADLRMQFVSLQNSPSPPPSRFSASDITGGK